MQPFTNTLSRRGFLLWTVISFVIWYLDLTFLYSKANDFLGGTGGFSTADTIFYWIIFALALVTLCLAILRRVQSAGLSRWWIILIILFFPIAWLVLLFLPPKKTVQPLDAGLQRI